MTKATAASTRPALTRDGLRRVIPRLEADRASVLASGASAAVKARTTQLVNDLKTVLTVAADDAGEPGDWVVVLAPKFQELTDNLRTALSLGVGKTGACLYSTPNGDRCIQCTIDQCRDIGGLFQADTPCPS